MNDVVKAQWLGRDIEELSRGELLEVIRYMVENLVLSRDITAFDNGLHSVISIYGLFHPPAKTNVEDM